MPSTKQPVGTPYSLDRAVSDEQDFWRNIGELIDASVEKAMVRHGLPEAVAAMKAVQKTQKILIERVNEIGRQEAGLLVSYDRLAAWCTVQGADNDQLRLDLKKFFELVTPLVAKPSPPP